MRSLGTLHYHSHSKDNQNYKILKGKMQGTINSFKQNSQNFKILEYLKTGASLTCLQAAQMGFGMNLRSRVSDLKRAGYDIKSEMIPIKDSYVAEYSLEVEDGRA